MNALYRLDNQLGTRKDSLALITCRSLKQALDGHIALAAGWHALKCIHNNPVRGSQIPRNSVL